MMQTSADHQLELRLSGQVTQKDYDEVLIPAIEAALKDHDKLRVLFVVADNFTGYDLGAVWADGRMGLTYWSGFERIAIAADPGWITTGVRAFAPLMPCPVQIFALNDTDAARRWLRESLGTVHMRDLDGRALHVELLGRPDAGDFDDAAGDLDALLRDRDGFRLLLDLREFDGWQGFSAVAGHFTLAREHAGLAQKVAIVGTHGWQKIAQRVVARFVNAETRYFAADDFEAAKTWLIEG